MTLPRNVGLVGGGRQRVTWRVPGASETRLQQILAQLGYLPLGFRPAHPIARTPDAQIAAAIAAPKGRFTWRYASIPDSLRALWHPGEDGTITRGALMAFQRDHDLTTDGVAGSQVWAALLAAVRSGDRSKTGYTYVMVSRAVPQTLALWVDGQVILRTPVNTGIAAAPTAAGTYPVFEHIASGTMSGTNPDGSHYNDPGVPWISYFNGGDALHGFPRGSYGVPQSLGCVEIPIGTAAKVWPHTPVGTLVTIA
jgi:peptidoglycan hydrolase-like protein with peptidoglycan-binding domain